MFFFPKLYKDISGCLGDDVVFVRVGNRAVKYGHGIQWKWQRVRKVLPGVYLGVKEPFFDFYNMFEKVG